MANERGRFAGTLLRHAEPQEWEQGLRCALAQQWHARESEHGRVCEAVRTSTTSSLHAASSAWDASRFSGAMLRAKCVGRAAQPLEGVESSGSKKNAKWSAPFCSDLDVSPGRVCMPRRDVFLASPFPDDTKAQRAADLDRPRKIQRPRTSQETSAADSSSSTCLRQKEANFDDRQRKGWITGESYTLGGAWGIRNNHCELG